MSEYRWMIAVIAVIAGMYFSAGTLGYDTTAADRAVSVDVVGDGEAYIALSYPDRTVSPSPDAEKTVVRVQNRFSQPVEVSVTAVVTADHGLSVDVPDIERQSLEVGEQLTVPMAITCAGERKGSLSTTVSFEVRATGESVSIETAGSRTVTYSVMCESPKKSPNDAGRTSRHTETPQTKIPHDKNRSAWPPTERGNQAGSLFQTA